MGIYSLFITLLLNKFIFKEKSNIVCFNLCIGIAKLDYFDSQLTRVCAMSVRQLASGKKPNHATKDLMTLLAASTWLRRPVFVVISLLREFENAVCLVSDSILRKKLRTCQRFGCFATLIQRYSLRISNDKHFEFSR